MTPDDPQDALRNCSSCGHRLTLRSSTREQDWRVQLSVCGKCGYRQLVESRIIRTASRRFKRGEGFDAEVARRRNT